MGEIIKVPMTGMVLDYYPELAKLDGKGVSGDPDDPVRLIKLDLGNVSWQLVSIDLEAEVMKILVEPGDRVDVPELDGGGRQKVDGKGLPLYIRRQATNEEKRGFLKHARNLIEGHTREDLYSMSGSPRLKISEKAKEKLRKVKKLDEK